MLRAGDCVGRYVIRSRLGVGGMGVVYGARDRALGRFVALKLVRRKSRGGTSRNICFIERLHREAVALARLSHPHVVSLYDMGSDNDVMFLAMEFVPGDPLMVALGRETLPWQKILQLFIQAGKGLAAAHKAGIIHRDFKPSNAIVGPDGHVTVVDFGLALGTENAPQADEDDFSPAALTRKLTEANLIIGTRGYMAPEQLLGREVGPACDQFSLCVALFEALHSVRPYPGDNAVETARSFAKGELAQTVRRDIPPYIEQAIARGLRVDPAERFESIDGLLAALDPKPLKPRRFGVAALVLAAAAASAAGTAWVGGIADGAEPQLTCKAGAGVTPPPP